MIGPMINVEDYLYFVDEALEGMVTIVADLGDELPTAGWTWRAPTRRTPCCTTAWG